MNGKREKRTGLRIRGARGHPVVRAALIRYARWVRTQYQFPIRVPVYLGPKELVTTIDGNRCSASFFAPWDLAEEPYIRIATGDYPLLKRQSGRDAALAAFIVSMSHEIVHYRQWVETGDVWERGVDRKAVAMLRRYELTVDHP
jgi:hypothetical protein